MTPGGVVDSRGFLLWGRRRSGFGAAAQLLGVCCESCHPLLIRDTKLIIHCAAT